QLPQLERAAAVEDAVADAVVECLGVGIAQVIELVDEEVSVPLGVAESALATEDAADGGDGPVAPLEEAAEEVDDDGDVGEVAGRRFHDAVSDEDPERPLDVERAQHVAARLEQMELLPE